MRKKSIIRILDNCINDIVINDKSKEECLCKNEAMREELEPLLEVVSHIHRVTKAIQLPLDTAKTKQREK